jgi:hypothetical protein
MSGAGIEVVAITGEVLVWAVIFLASWQGKQAVGWIVSDGLLVLLAVIIGYRIWRLCRRGQQKSA